MSRIMHVSLWSVVDSLEEELMLSSSLPGLKGGCPHDEQSSVRSGWLLNVFLWLLKESLWVFSSGKNITMALPALEAVSSPSGPWSLDRVALKA